MQADTLYEHLPRATSAADLEALLPWNMKALLKARARNVQEFDRVEFRRFSGRNSMVSEVTKYPLRIGDTPETHHSASNFDCVLRSIYNYDESRDGSCSLGCFSIKLALRPRRCRTSQVVLYKIGTANALQRSPRRTWS
jgi:hypothetical protein